VVSQGQQKLHPLSMSGTPLCSYSDPTPLWLAFRRLERDGDIGTMLARHGSLFAQHEKVSCPIMFSCCHSVSISQSRKEGPSTRSISWNSASEAVVSCRDLSYVLCKQLRS
jgi:hypothetical protein